MLAAGRTGLAVTHRGRYSPGRLNTTNSARSDGYSYCPGSASTTNSARSDAPPIGTAIYCFPPVM